MEQQKIRVIITGSTGMVGEGVLLECLNHPMVEAVLIINRKPLGIAHPKLKEIIYTDFFNISPIVDQLKGYNACYFCLGISSVGINAEDYYKTTYILTMHIAETLSTLNPGMTFTYVSGAGTDSSEKGRVRWARVKGKTENHLSMLPFKQQFNFRPGFIKPTRGQSKAHKFYRYINWMFPIGRKIYPKGFCTMHELALAMINVTLHGFNKNVVDGKDIIKLGAK